MAIKEQLKFFILFHLIFTNNLNMQLKMKSVPKLGKLFKEHFQGSYASGKCQGNLNFFKVRELSGNFMLCQ